MTAVTAVTSATAMTSAHLRQPKVADGPAIWGLVKATGVLDVNSCYAYVALCDHFAATCVVAEAAGEVVGFITGYRPPSRPEVFFVWQVAVADRARGQGLAGRMLTELLGRESAAGVRFLETTVTPSNEPSRRLFTGFARRCGVACRITEGHYGGDLLGDPAHEPEALFRLGPFPSAPTTIPPTSSTASNTDH